MLVDMEDYPHAPKSSTSHHTSFSTSTSTPPPPSPLPSAYSYGTFMKDGIRRIDYVLVYKESEKEEKENDERRKFYEVNCVKEGLELERDHVKHEDEILVFTKVHIPWNTLCKQAELLGIKAPLWIHDKPIIKKQKYDDANKKTRMYGKNTVINVAFKKKHIERFAIRDERTFFADVQRIEIAYEMLQTIANSPRDERKRGLEQLLEEKVYETAFPIHDSDADAIPTNGDSNTMPKRQWLKQSWASWNMVMHRQPLNEIRNYFGEKIGFYYAFMDCYTRMLIYPSIVGLLTFMIGIISTASNPDVTEICKSKYGLTQEDGPQVGSVQTETENEFYMCPICKPPHCEHWELQGSESCFYYSWAYRLDNPWSFVLSGFTTLWAITFIKLWKRRESALAVDWNVHDVEEQEIVIRPEYEERAPTRRKNPITQEIEPFVPFRQKAMWMSVSVMATILFLFFACCCLIALVIGRIQLYAWLRYIPGPIGKKNVDCSRWLVHGLLFITVSILESLYSKAAHKLTAYECPKTDKKYMDSLLWKIFIFAMLNDIIPIGYAAWVKGRTVKTPLNLSLVDELCDAGCMGEVTELVAVLLLLRLIIGNLTEIGIPVIKHVWNQRKKKKPETASEHHVVPQYVKDFHLNEVEMDGVFEDYMEMMIQFAFIVLFIPALPVAPFVCFLNNIAEIRVDGVKMIKTNRRPLPIRVAGIGIWNRFLDILSRMGIICNAALLAFTSDNVLFLYYTLIHNPGAGFNGFTKFMLSKIEVEGYGSNGHEMTKLNITECWYPDLRQPYEPYELKDYYWEVLTFKFMVFAAYTITFLIVTWFVNTFISDMPESAIIKSQRQRHIVNKSAENEATLKAHKMVSSAFKGKKNN